MSIDATLFCEIIETIPSVNFLRQENEDGYIGRCYQGKYGLVIIDYDDDNFSDDLGEEYLIQLGLNDLISSIFPKNAPIVVDVDIPTPLRNEIGDGDDCLACNGVGTILQKEEMIQCTVCNGTGTKLN